MIKGIPANASEIVPVFIWVICIFMQPITVHASAAQWQQYDTHNEAIAVINHQNKLVANGSESADIYTARGNAYFELRQFEKAIDDFSRAITIDNGADLAYFGRGMAYGRLGVIDQAIDDLSTYIDRHPGSSLAYTKRGIRHLWNNDAASAERDLNRAIELNPRNAEAHDDLGVILAQRGEYDEAIRHFSTTTSIDPSYQKGFHNLAMVYYITGRNDAALASVNTALDLIPETRNSLLLKGTILKALGRDKDAEEILEQAEFLPEGGWSEQAPIN